MVSYKGHGSVGKKGGLLDFNTVLGPTEVWLEVGLIGTFPYKGRSNKDGIVGNS